MSSPICASMSLTTPPEECHPSLTYMLDGPHIRPSSADLRREKKRLAQRKYRKRLQLRSDPSAIQEPSGIIGQGAHTSSFTEVRDDKLDGHSGNWPQADSYICNAANNSLGVLESAYPLQLNDWLPNGDDEWSFLTRDGGIPIPPPTEGRDQDAQSQRQQHLHQQPKAREQIRGPPTPARLPHTEPAMEEKRNHSKQHSSKSKGEPGPYPATTKPIPTACDERGGEAPQGVTPLFQAAAAGNARILGLLVRRSACPEKGDDRGQTILHVAARHGRRSAVALLLDYGFPVNARDRCGNTALHLAVEHGWEDVVELLVDAGADVDGANYRLPEATVPAVGGE